MPAIDRRSSPRVEVGMSVRLERSVGNAVAARTVDLGAGGMRVQTARPLRVDEVLHFQLDLGEGRELSGDSRVLRMHPGSRYALRFEQLHPRDEAALKTFVATRA